jgi:hypothetical protein
MSYPIESNNINEAIPLFLKALLSDNVITVDILLKRFPNLIKLLDKNNRNVLMLTVYGRPGYFDKNNQFVPPIHNNAVIGYLMAFWVENNPLPPPGEYIPVNDHININAVDNDYLTALDWAILSKNDFAISLIEKFTKR